MEPTLAADAADILKWPFFGALGIIAVGLLITILGVITMLRSPGLRTRGEAAAPGPWDIVKSIVTAFIGWGTKALAVFNDKTRPTGEKLIGLGLFLTFVGVLLAVVTGVLLAAIGGGDDDGGGGSATPTPEP